MRGFNYIRNSVKVTVDAYHGTVAFYVADPEDPLIRTYAQIFPGLLKPLDEMPKDLQAHIRYPEDLFTVQARMYATYHMQDPQVFYNKEDLWVLPRLSQDGREREMEPYFTVMRLPSEPKEEFVLLSGFNPSGRDNMIALMVARMDPPLYGGIIVLRFPEAEARVRAAQHPGPDQPGSGDLAADLALEPAGLAGDHRHAPRHPHRPVAALRRNRSTWPPPSRAPCPELRRVVVAYGNQIAMEPTLEASLARIFGGRVRGEEVVARPAERGQAPPPVTAAITAAVQQAWEAWQRGQEALRKGDWASYGQEQKRIEEALRRLREGR